MEVIITHINADFDSLASMLAAKKLYPEAVPVFPGSQEKSIRDFFIQSTIYVFEIERLKNIDFESIHRLILVDTRQTGRIGRFARIIGKPDLDIHIYDHHQPSSDDISGAVEVIREVGATTTLLTEILKDRNIDITPDEATVMALGIYEDTGSFIFSSTTVDDFQAAAYLLSKGANLNVISDMIIKEFSAEDISLLNDLLQSATTHTINGIDVVVAKASTDKYTGDFAVLVHKLKDTKNINILFALARMGDRVHLVCRSRVDDVNVGEIAMEFGGGGHATAASATIKDLTLIQVEEKLLSLLQSKMGGQRYAKGIMSFPVKVVESTESLLKAGDLLTRYNINVLPVVKGGELVGIISRQVIEKAAFHGLQDLPTEEYMSTDFAVADPDTPLLAIQKIIVGDNQRFLPVVESGKVVGGITRTDLLRIMQSDLMKKPSYLHDSGHDPRFTRRKSVYKLMKERLDQRILETLQVLGTMAEDLYYSAYLMGGIVRDLILRRENSDVDIVVEGDGIELARQFSRVHSCKVKSYKKFGTATLVFPDGFKVDLATARLEYYESPGALPTVELGSIKLDLYRRDFTMNTLAIRLNPTGFGELIDFFGAQKDIKERRIRVIHNLSFVEDPTRIFRAIRFEQRFGFQIGRHTAKLIKNAVKMNFLDQLDGYRFLSELMHIFEEEEPVSIIKRLAELDILRFIHPGIQFDEKMKRILENIRDVLSWFDLLFLEEKYEKWEIYFFGLTDSIPKCELQEVCKRLSMTEKNEKRVINGVQEADSILRRLGKGGGMVRSAIYKLLKPVSAETLLYSMAKTEKEYIRRIISLYFTQLKRTRLHINGKDLKGMGITPGIIFKRIMDNLMEAKLDGILETKEDEIRFVRENFADSLGSQA